MSDTRSLVTDAELDAAADALGWPANEQARAHALIALTAAARVRREERVTPEEEVHDEMCPGCSTCLHPDATPSGGAASICPTGTWRVAAAPWRVCTCQVAEGSMRGMPPT